MKAWVIKFLSVGFLLGFTCQVVAECGHVFESMTEDAILKRIEPVGAVELSGDAPAKPSAQPAKLAANAGEKRYKATCAVCHDAGIGGAPKFRNKAEWSSRMAAGMDEMLKIAIKGKGAMPPRGTCMQCSDEELKMAIEYMLPQ